MCLGGAAGGADRIATAMPPVRHSMPRMVGEEGGRSVDREGWVLSNSVGQAVKEGGRRGVTVVLRAGRSAVVESLPNLRYPFVPRSPPPLTPDQCSISADQCFL